MRVGSGVTGTGEAVGRSELMRRDYEECRLRFLAVLLEIDREALDR